MLRTRTFLRSKTFLDRTHWWLSVDFVDILCELGGIILIKFQVDVEVYLVQFTNLVNTCNKYHNLVYYDRY